LGLILVGLGLLITITSMIVKTADGEKIGSIAWRPLIFIIAANVIFGIALGGIRAIGLPPMGMVAGIYALTLVACNAGDKFILKEALVLATILSALSYVAFILLLKLQFPVWPPFFTA
jgi:hypothetical protein